MTETTWASLRQLLTDRYDELRKRLTRRLQSEELARETLHETWLRLDRNDEIGAIKSPAGYLMRMAINVAFDRKRTDQRLARADEVSAFLDDLDAAPDPARDAEARIEIVALERALEELTPRRRAVLLSSRLEGKPMRQIAEELGISLRLTELELKDAVEHCAERLDRKVVKFAVPAPPKRLSEDQSRNR